MYKMRIAKWGLEKNTNAARVTHMLRRKRDRAAAGKTSAFSIHNRPVDWTDVERYLQRRPDVLAKIDSNIIEIGSASAGIVCRSPSPDPAHMLSVPPPLAPERFTRLHDDVLYVVRDYMDGRAGYVGEFRSSPWSCDIWSVVHRGASPAKAVAVINSRMDRLTVMIQEMDCSLFLQMLRAYHYLHEWNRDVCAVVAVFVADMCEVQLGPRHPFTQAWRRVQALDDAGLRETLADAMRLQLDYLAAQAAWPNERSTLSLLEEHFMALSMRWQSNAAEIDRLVTWILEYADRRKEPLSSDYCRLMLRLAVPQAFHGNYNVALRMLRIVAAWLDEGRTDDVYFAMVASRYHFNVSLLLDDVGDVAGSQEHIRLGRELCNLYEEPSEQLVGHSQEHALGYGVAGNPEKAARWLALIDGSFGYVLKMANATRSCSTRDGHSVSTSGMTPEVPGLGEEDGLPQVERQDGVRKEPEPVKSFLEQLNRVASMLPICLAST
jgi:hypothetical protein